MSRKDRGRPWSNRATSGTTFRSPMRTRTSCTRPAKSPASPCLALAVIEAGDAVPELSRETTGFLGYMQVQERWHWDRMGGWASLT